MAAITTIRGHVARALDFYSKTSVYVGIGKSSEWSEDDRTELTPEGTLVSDDFPPIPMADNDLKEFIAMKKVDNKFLVYPSEDGELGYRGTKWAIATPESAVELGARWVYISTKLSYNDVSTDIDYRQVGVYSNVVPKESGETKYVLFPSDIDGMGLLEVLDNRKPIYREPDQQETLTFLIEF